jgi:membrane protein
LPILKRAASQFSEDRCSTLAASLAYYTIFSLPPMLFILVTTVGIAVSWYYGDQQGNEQAMEMIQTQISRMIGNEAASEEIGQIMRSNMQQPGLGWKTLLSLAGVLVAATGVVASLQQSLNLVWRIKPDPEASSWKPLIAKRLMSLAMIVGLGLVLIASFIVGSLLESFSTTISESVGIQVGTASAINYVVTFAVTVIVFAAVFRVMPDAEIAWRDVWAGALITAILFAVGRIAISYYLAYSSPGQQLGAAAGSLVVILVWVYYSSLIVLFGAEVTQSWTLHSGRLLKPEKGSVKFTEKIISSTA